MHLPMPMPMPMLVPMPIRNRLADKHHVRRVYDAMESQYKEMGMSTVVFVCYTRPDGKLAIDA
jgi:hypothetical protein